MFFYIKGMFHVKHQGLTKKPEIKPLIPNLWGLLGERRGDIMIYKCRWCRKEINNLRTPGDDVCHKFVCRECADLDRKDWQKEILKDPNPDPSVLIV